MSRWLQVAGWVLPGLLGYWAGRRRGRGRGLEVVGGRWHVLLAIALGGLSLGALVWAHQRPGLVLGLPLWAQDRALALAWLIMVGAVVYLGSLSATRAWVGGHRERGKVLLVCALFAAAAMIVQWTFTRSIHAGLEAEETSDGVVLQSSAASSGAASGANLARRLGASVGESEMARLMGTTLMGTTAAQMVRGLARLGIHCESLDERSIPPEGLPFPLLAFVDGPQAGPGGHVVVLDSETEGGVLGLDPRGGRVFWSEAHLRQRWTGRGLVCRR